MLPAKRRYATRSRPPPPSHSAEEIAGNEDLLTEIILRLPIRSLMRFKSVSKAWLALISGRPFSLLRRSRDPAPDPTTGLILGRESSFDFVRLDPTAASAKARPPFEALSFAGSRERLRILQSCKGLLLYSTEKGKWPRKNYVHNPTTKQFVKLPPLSMRALGLSLAFDPQKSPHYKVVCVELLDTRIGHYLTRIYSSETGDWETPGTTFSLQRALRLDTGVYWNGSVHWMCYFSPPMRFDVDGLAVSPMPTPPNQNRNHNRWFLNNKHNHFLESGGHLYWVDHEFNLLSPKMDVHEMELDYSRWTLRFRVDLSRMPSSFPQAIRRREHGRLVLGDYMFTLLGIFCCNDGSCSLVLQVPGKVVRYNVKTGTFVKLWGLGHGSRGAKASGVPLVEWCNVHQFAESLALV